MIKAFLILGLALFAIGFVLWVLSYKNDDGPAHYRALVTIAISGWIILPASICSLENPILQGILAVIVIAYTIYVADFTTWFVFKKPTLSDRIRKKKS